jgi:hypothetical protein
MELTSLVDNKDFTYRMILILLISSTYQYSKGTLEYLDLEVYARSVPRVTKTEYLIQYTPFATRIPVAN